MEVKNDIATVQPGEFIKIKQDNPITSFVSVSSAVAERWLAHNTHNRPISEQAVMEYQSDMEAGRFKFTGEPIQFSISGVLLNGQNRLTALANCIPSVTLVFNVIRGLDDAVQSYMDIGKKRTPGQQLNILGVRNSNQIASMTRLLIAWKSGALWSDIRGGRAISIPRVEEWVADNQRLVELFNRNLCKQTRSVGGTPSVAGAVAIEALRIDTPAAVSFFNLLSRRVGLPEDSPLLALDARLRRFRSERKRVPQREELAFFIQTWNYWMRGESIVRLNSAKGGWSRTSFPTLDTERGRRFDWDQFQRGLDLAGYEQ